MRLIQKRNRLGIIGSTTQCRAAVVLLSLGLFAGIEARSETANTPYQANGVKVGEVTQTSAIVWTRLTKIPERRNHGYVLTKDDEFKMHNVPKNAATSKKYPEDVNLVDMYGATPGVTGEVRLTYEAKGKAECVRTSWTQVDDARDYAHKFKIEGLTPKTEYMYQVECRASEAGPVGPTIFGRFRTVPEVDNPAPVLFTVVTGHKYQNRDREDGHQIFNVMREMKPDFFVHTGDIVYMNRQARRRLEARFYRGIPPLSQRDRRISVGDSRARGRKAQYNFPASRH